LERQNFIFE
ncbi:unnamed protein product, partial [Rotaria magnacalcarata]